MTVVNTLRQTNPSEKKDGTSSENEHTVLSFGGQKKDGTKYAAFGFFILLNQFLHVI